MSKLLFLSLFKTHFHVYCSLVNYPNFHGLKQHFIPSCVAWENLVESSLSLFPLKSVGTAHSLVGVGVDCVIRKYFFTLICLVAVVVVEHWLKFHQ